MNKHHLDMTLVNNMWLFVQAEYDPIKHLLCYGT